LDSLCGHITKGKRTGFVRLGRFYAVTSRGTMITSDIQHRRIPRAEWRARANFDSHGFYAVTARGK